MIQVNSVCYNLLAVSSCSLWLRAATANLPVGRTPLFLGFQILRFSVRSILALTLVAAFFLANAIPAVKSSPYGSSYGFGSRVWRFEREDVSRGWPLTIERSVLYPALTKIIEIDGVSVQTPTTIVIAFNGRDSAMVEPHRQFSILAILTNAALLLFVLLAVRLIRLSDVKSSPFTRRPTMRGGTVPASPESPSFFGKRAVIQYTDW